MDRLDYRDEMQKIPTMDNCINQYVQHKTLLSKASTLRNIQKIPNQHYSALEVELLHSVSAFGEKDITHLSGGRAIASMDLKDENNRVAIDAAFQQYYFPGGELNPKIPENYNQSGQKLIEQIDKNFSSHDYRNKQKAQEVVQDVWRKVHGLSEGESIFGVDFDQKERVTRFLGNYVHEIQNPKLRKK